MAVTDNQPTPPDPASAAARTHPFTSQEYMESLRDGREIWIYGERVKDVTTHPAFRNTTRMLARLYDALHDERKSILCTETDTGSGGFVGVSAASSAPKPTQEAADTPTNFSGPRTTRRSLLARATRLPNGPA